MTSDDGKITQNSGQITEKRKGRPENLKPWKPGESGNPGGRPRTKLFRKALLDLLADTEDESNPSERLRKIAAKLLDAAEKGDVRAAEFLRDSTDGRPSADGAADAGTPIVVNIGIAPGCKAIEFDEE
jgi:uncharacterized protein DUF5681